VVNSYPREKKLIRHAGPVNMSKHVRKEKTFYLFLLLMLLSLYQTDAAADGPFIDYATIGIAFPTPSDYINYDFGTGAYINAGHVTDSGFGYFELSYFDTIKPADSDYATNIELERVAGSGPTKFYSRAVSGMFGFISKDPKYLFKAGIGFSYRDYRLVRPGVEDKDKDWGLSYGAGIGTSVYKNNYIVLEYYIIDHLIGTGNLGLQISL